MNGWWAFLLGALCGGTVTLVLYAIILAGARPGPLWGRWKGEHTGTEIDIEAPEGIPAETRVWIREGRRSDDPHRSVERAWPAR